MDETVASAAVVNLAPNDPRPPVPLCVLYR